jgi:type VI protein secretion system component Hcp
MKPTSLKRVGERLIRSLLVLLAMSVVCVDVTLAATGDESDIAMITVTIDNLGGSQVSFVASSFSLGSSNQANPCLSTRAAPKVSVQDLHIVKDTDGYTPLLAVASLMGTHLQKVTIGVVVPETILEIVLGNAVISSFQQGGSDKGSANDQLSFNYSTITWQFSGGKIKGWNVCQNAPYSPPQGE